MPLSGNLFYVISSKTRGFFKMTKFPFLVILQNIQQKLLSPEICLFSFPFYGMHVLLLKHIHNFFFYIYFFFTNINDSQDDQGKGEVISLTPIYHFHLVHRYLDIIEKGKQIIKLLKISLNAIIQYNFYCYCFCYDHYYRFHYYFKDNFLHDLLASIKIKQHYSR